MTAELEIPEEARSLFNAKMKADALAATFPEEYRGIVEYIALNDALRGDDEDQGWAARSYEGLVLKYGYPSSWSPRPKSIAQGTVKECYSNSFWLAHTNDEYMYVEGYAVSSVLPIAVQHAWVIDRKGQVIDPTWRDGSVYFGIPMSTDFVGRRMLATKFYGVLCNDWVDGHQMIQHGFVTDVDDERGVTYVTGIGES